MSDLSPHAGLSELLDMIQQQGIDETWAPDMTIRPVEQQLGETLAGIYDVTRPGGNPKVLPEIVSSETGKPETSELQILGPLGEGGMGYVQLALQSALEREVALKRILPARRSAHAIEALMNEARLSGGLEHPNIVPVHALGRLAGDEPVMVMKRVEGVVWRELIRDPEHPSWALFPGEDRLVRHLEILMQVCRAVEFAHSRGVLHLDIKTENVMVGEFGEVYLMDWGVARAQDEVLDEAGAESVVGTPSYMAPEMVRGKGQTTPQSDVFLLGATLHEVLTGETRHQGENVMNVMFNALETAPFDFPPNIPHELAEICNRACALEPASRFAGAGALRTSLLEFSSHRGALELSDAALVRLDELRASNAGREGGELDDDEHRRRVQGLFSACRFGFEQSLREWNGNEAAQVGLQECLELMIGHELHWHNVAAAASLIAILPVLRPELSARCEALRAKLVEEGDARKKLAVIRRETTIRSRTWASSIGFTVNGVVWCIFAILWGWGVQNGQIPDSDVFNLYLGIGGVTAMLLTMLVFRRLFLVNTIRRQFTLAFVVYIFIFVSNRVIGVQLDAPLHTVILMDHVDLTVFVGVLAALVHSALWWAFVVCVLSMWAGSTWVEHVFNLGALSLLVVNMVIAYAVRPDPELDASAETLF